MIKRGMRPSHVGAMLRDMMDGIMEETGKKLTSQEVAKGLGTSPKTLSSILNEHKGINSEMAIRLSKAFGSTPDFWLKLQSNYDLWYAEKKVDRATIRRF